MKGILVDLTVQTLRRVLVGEVLFSGDLKRWYDGEFVRQEAVLGKSRLLIKLAPGD